MSTPDPATRSTVRESVLRTAAELLVTDPDASVVEIAAKAGVGRASFYRHFPSREALLAAVRQQALDELLAALEAAGLDDLPPAEALDRLIDVLLGSAMRYQALTDLPFSVPGDRERELAVAAPMFRVVERAQAEGLLRQDLPSNWLLLSLASLLRGAQQSVHDGERDAREAGRLLRESFLHGAAPPAG